MVHVPKESGGWCPRGDYTWLIDATQPNTYMYMYPVPHFQHFPIHLGGKKAFSKLDLIRVYHQIPVAADNISKTAITCMLPFSLFELLWMPFGLKNAAQAFQQLMDSVCQGLALVFIYVDNILVAHHKLKTTNSTSMRMAWSSTLLRANSARIPSILQGTTSHTRVLAHSPTK